MPPTVILIRHAQALHNVENDYSIPDPELSQLGWEQCGILRERLQKLLPGRFDVPVVIVSAMRRTLQTAMAALDWLQPDVPFQAHAGWQETTNHTCDIGSPVTTLVQEFPSIDFSKVDPVFPEKLTPAGAFYAYQRSALLARAQSVLAELHAMPEDKTVVVVSHSSFLCKAVSGTMFGNADYRIFSFEDKVPGEAGDKDTLRYRLREWDETRLSHGGMGWSMDETKKLGDGLPE